MHTAGPLYLIVEFAIYGSLKDYLHQCKEVVLKLNHVPQIVNSRRRSHHPSISSTYPALRREREKIPLSQQSSVFSEISQSSRVNAASSSSSSSSTPTSFHSTQGGPRARCPTQDSGFCGGEPGTFQLSSYVARDYINCKGLLYMEDVMNFAFQIACGLQHLEKLKVTVMMC